MRSRVRGPIATGWWHGDSSQASSAFLLVVKARSATLTTWRGALAHLASALPIPTVPAVARQPVSGSRPAEAEQGLVDEAAEHQAALRLLPITTGTRTGPGTSATDDQVRVVAGTHQDVGHRQAAVAAGADEIDRHVLGELVHARRSLCHRDESGARDVATHERAGLMDVDDDRAVGVGCGECDQGNSRMLTPSVMAGVRRPDTEGGYPLGAHASPCPTY
jgi:hypothetical protein